MPRAQPCSASRRRLKHAARLLDAACTRAGLSNVELAKRLQVGRDSVSKQRRGTQWLDVESLLALAELLQIAPGSLFPDDPTSPLSQLLQEAAGLSPEMQATVLAFVRGFTRELRSQTPSSR